LRGSRLCHRPWSSSPESAATWAGDSPRCWPTTPRSSGSSASTRFPPPRQLPLGRTEFVRADIRNPLIAKVIATAAVDTVVHLNITAVPRGRRRPRVDEEMNVIGTMQLLAACQKSASVRQLVVKSSTAVYGSSSRDPALFTEEMEPRSLPRSGIREGLRRGRGLRARVRPAAGRTSRWPCSGSPT
jgi:hypothetical protein